MTLNPDAFSPQRHVTTIGDLDDNEAATIAMTVYHEARHAEQTFRIAREGGDVGVPDEVAEAAAEQKGRPSSRAERAQVKEWRDFTIGAEATYREAVNTWMDDIREAVRIARRGEGDVQERLAAKVRAWGKPSSAASFIHDHLADARRRGATRVVAEIGRLEDVYARVKAASAAGDLKALTDALMQLSKVIFRAYGDQPVEADAWDTGNAVYDAFVAALRKPRAAAVR